jgi:D-amino-acid oxidase
MSEIAVVGSGIIGMTTALYLAEAGHKVIIISKEKYQQTTSITAAALWWPFKAYPEDKVSHWSLRTLAVYLKETPISQTGIIWQDVSELVMPEAELPWWSSTVENFTCNEKILDLPAGKRKAFSFRAPIIDTALYMQYLQKLLDNAGVHFINKQISSFDEAFALSNIVVNCAGIGAIQLANDRDLHPGRGQVVRIKRQEHHKAMVDATQEPKLAYVIPRINDTILGGTYEKNDFYSEPRPDEIDAIIERCQSIQPDLVCTQADILDSKCGLRPLRSSVRVEKEKSGDKNLYHNYGHGGSGFTIAWGCAEEICSLISDEVTPVKKV